MSGKPEAFMEEIVEIRDEGQILTVVNQGAMRYKGVIPDDCWHEPYMPLAELKMMTK